jgi:cytochrome P450
MYHLLANRRVYDKLTEELDEAVREGKPMDINNLHRLPYLHAVVQEGIRLGTPFPGLPRVTPSGGVVLAGVYIPGETIVSVPAYAQQVSRDNFFPSPLQFWPERWLSDALDPDFVLNPNGVMCFSTGEINFRCFFPSWFHGFTGPFSCLGKSLAIKELHVFVARLLVSCHVELAPKFDEEKFLNSVKNMRTTVFTHPLMTTVRTRGTA